MTKDQISLCDHCIRVMRMAFNHLPDNGEQYRTYIRNSLEWAMRDLSKMLSEAEKKNNG